MLERLFEKVRPWVEAMGGADEDPRGEFLLMLETRVSLLEDEVARRGSDRSDACGASTPTSNAEAE
jgi:hypothetical protein